MTIDVVRLRHCNSQSADREECQATTLDGVGGGAYFQHDLQQLWSNASYCLFFRPVNPHCKGDYGCLFYTRCVNCYEL